MSSALGGASLVGWYVVVSMEVDTKRICSKLLPFV